MSNCSAVDDRVEIRWAESVLYGPGGTPSSDPRFTFTYDPRVHDRDEFWREGATSRNPEYPTRNPMYPTRNPEYPTPPVEPYGREPGSQTLHLGCMIHTGPIGYSDSAGKPKKCHCKLLSFYPMIFSIRRSFGTNNFPL